MKGKWRFVFILVVVGVMFTYMGTMDLIRGSKTPADYNVMMEADYDKGMIVEGDLYANLGAFEENYTTRNGVKTGSSRYNYMIPVGEKQFMGLLNNTADLETALETQADATFDYWNGDTNEEPLPVHFKGRVMKMSSETKGYLHDYMISMGYTEDEANDYILDYYIKCENYDGWLWQLVVGGVSLLIVLIIVLIPVISSRNKKDVMFASSSTSQTAADSTFTNDTGFETEQETAAAYDDSGLGTGIAEDYRSEEAKQSGLGLKLKDD